MNKTAATLRERIATRAYFAWLNGSTAGAEADWIEAEAVETALAARRAASAAKAARTRRAKAATRAPAEMLIAAKGRLPSRRPTAH